MRKAFKTIGMLLLTAPITWGASAYAAPASSSSSFEAPDEVCTGQVVDETGEPVIGAAVKAQGALGGVVTDIDGNFRIPNVKPGTAIEVNYIGYNDASVVWNGTPITIKLEPSNQLLDEVVVTALGMKRETKALGYAVTEIKGDDLNSNLVNPVTALQGKVAGVQIEHGDGSMFGNAKILIRGASTLGSNNQPIYVVDGVILDNGITNGNPDWDGGQTDYGNELKNLNPDDFESVSVLKGAAATALYGSRGLNGAVVITTKSGQKSGNAKVTVSQTLGFDKVTSTPKFQNEFGPGYLPGFVSWGDKDPDGNYYKFDTHGQFRYNDAGDRTLVGMAGYFGYGPAFDGEPIEYYDGTVRPYQAYKNNYKDAYQTGFNTNTNVSVSGGNENTTFYTSLSYKYAEGIIPNNTFERISFMAKASQKIGSRVTLDASMSFANSKPRNAPSNLGENFASGTWTRDYDVAYAKNKYKGEHGGLADLNYGDEYGHYIGNSIWWNIFENDYTQKETSVRPDLKVTVDIMPWLKWNAEGNYNYYYVRYESKQPGAGYANDGGYYGLGQSTKEQTNFNTNFLFNANLMEDLTFNGFIRGEYYHNFYQSMSMGTNGGLIFPNKFFLGNSKNQVNSSGNISGEKTMWSVAFQASFGWRDQLYLDVTGRNDWSSALVYSDKHGDFSYFYPSVSGSWLIHNTLRDKLPTWISFMKIRGSWAQVGNDTDPYTINTAYGLTTTKLPDGTQVVGTSVPNTAYDQNLKPERKTSWELGLDWRFINNRIGLDFTYYKENTKNQIMSISLPSESGLSSQLINAGNIQNSGVEIALNTTPIQTRDWTWDLNFTYTRNRSKIVELHPNVSNYITLSGDISYGNYRIGSVAKVGEEYGMLISDSNPMKDQATGLPILNWRDGERGAHLLRSEMLENEDRYDENGNYIGTIDVNNGKIGSMMPDFLGSVNTSLRYKNFTLSASLDMRFGGYVASYNARYGTAYGFTEGSLYGAPGHGGLTWTSKFDGVTYHDGIIPDGIIMTGTSIAQPDGSTYTVGVGSTSKFGETYRELYDKGIVEPTHHSTWLYRNGAWTMAGRNYGVNTDDWVKKLNYIALREISLTYTCPQSFYKKLGMTHLNLTATGHNIGYLLNTAPQGTNPESIRGTVASEFRIRGFEGVTSSYTFTINVGF